jgi:hypothetical protein
MKLLQIDNAFMLSVVAAVLMSAVLMISFVALEPSIGYAATDEFTISQVITGEISFSTPASDVALAPAIAGLTGGIGNGSTDVVVTTNNATGYNMTIAFSSSTAMYRNGGGDDIDNYVTAVGGTADFTFDSAEVFAQFGYTVETAISADVDPTFRDDGATCGAGGTYTADSCWMDPDTVAETIVDTSVATPASGATTTIKFRVDVPANPVPAISTGTYTATATLTALTNP